MLDVELERAFAAAIGALVPVAVAHARAQGHARKRQLALEHRIRLLSRQVRELRARVDRWSHLP